MTMNEIANRAGYLSAVADIPSATAWNSTNKEMTIEDKIKELADLIEALAENFSAR